MAGKKFSLRSLFKQQSKRKMKEARSCEKKVGSAEQLEPRLCLGSMHAGLAAWGQHDAAPNLAPPEIRLQEDVASNLSKSVPTDPDHVEQADLKDLETRSEHEQNKQSISTIRFQPAQVSNIQSSHQAGRHIGSAGVDSNLRSPFQADDASEIRSEQFDSITPHSLSGELDSQTKLEKQLRSAAPVLNSTHNALAENSVNPTTNAPALDQVNFRHQERTPTQWDSSLLASIGLQTDSHGNATGLVNSEVARQSGYEAWWSSADEPVVIKYDFRSFDGHENQITDVQKQLAVQALETWSHATERQIVFEHDTEAANHRIINIGVGDLAAVGHVSGEGAVLGLGGGQVTQDGGQLIANGVAWLDKAEKWDNVAGNGNPEGTTDFSTVVGHEIGHSLGYGDQYGNDADNAMNGTYTGERDSSSIQKAVDEGYLNRTIVDQSAANAIVLQPMSSGMAQLTEAEVQQLLQRGAAASDSQDAIIAVVDRNGRILGVRVEADVLASITSVRTLVFAIDGAVAKARTAAMFSNGDPANGTLAPLTSRTVRFLSQSTITQREVESNPNVDNGSLAEALASTRRGPGFVAPIGVGGHFPPEINFTPLVDLFGIEHTNRDTTLHPGPDGIKGTADDIDFDNRFNIDGNFVDPGQELVAPESYGNVQNSGLLPDAQSRGIATLPGGVPLFRDTSINGQKDGIGTKDGLGDTLVGGIGVFFPGEDGFATHEQGFVPGIGQTEFERNNAPKALEAEFIAFAAAGGSQGAVDAGIEGAKVGALDGVEPVAGIDIPFGRLDLVGIQLEVFGPMGAQLGAEMLVDLSQTLNVGVAGSSNSGADQVVTTSGEFYRAGEEVPVGWLVNPHDSADGSITAADVRQIIENGVTAAENVRAAVRLPLSNATRMVLAVTDTNGEVLGLFRMQDATTFSIDVAVAKARNVAYFADGQDIQGVDLVGPRATAYTNRTFRFLAQPRFPSGINGTEPAPFSILHDGNINQLTAENNGAAAAVGEFVDVTRDDNPSVYGRDSFFPNTNFRDPGDGVNPAGSADAYHIGHDTVANQNGIVFFPGSTPLYKDGRLIGGFGVSGDGVDQDDVVTYVGATGFLPEDHGVFRADQSFVRGIRLPYQKFLRNPFGGLCPHDP